MRIGPDVCGEFRVRRKEGGDRWGLMNKDKIERVGILRTGQTENCHKTVFNRLSDCYMLMYQVEILQYIRIIYLVLN